MLGTGHEPQMKQRGRKCTVGIQVAERPPVEIGSKAVYFSDC